MNQIRNSLTRLRTKIGEKLPDGDDLFGYPGVSRTTIVEFVSEAHGLTVRIENLRGTFGIVVLKRKISPLLDKCREYLEEGITGSNAKEGFDDFVSALTAIHDEIYLTYVIYCSQTLRTEAEIEAAIAQLTKLSEVYEEKGPEVREIANSMSRIKELDTATQAAGEQIEERLENANAFVSEIDKLKADASASAQVITKFETETKTQKEQMGTVAASINAEAAKLRKLVADGSSQTKQITKILENANETLELNKKHEGEIAATLRLASKYGMAASFKQRKDELRVSMVLWALAFGGAITGIFLTGIFYIFPEGGTNALPGNAELLAKVSLITPLIWLGWMAAKQYGYLSKIREDYSFKYASALAFEGYKREAAEVDPALLVELVEVATTNMALHPLRIYEGDSDHASPVNEILSKVLDRKVKKLQKPDNT